MTAHQHGADEDAPVFDGLMAEAMTGGEHFGHRQHVHLTWLAVRRYGTEAAVRVVSDGIRRTASYAGAPPTWRTSTPLSPSSNPSPPNLSSATP